MHFEIFVRDAVEVEEFLHAFISAGHGVREDIIAFISSGKEGKLQDGGWATLVSPNVKLHLIQYRDDIPRKNGVVVAPARKDGSGKVDWDRGIAAIQILE